MLARPYFLSLLCLTLAFGGLSPLRLTAAEASVTVREVQIGLGGKYKAGHWAPLWITLAANRSDVAGELAVVATDGDDTPVVFPSDDAPIQLAAGEQGTYLRYAKIGPIRGRLSIQLRNSDVVLWEQSLADLVPPPLHSTQELVVTLGEGVGLEEALATIKRPAELSYAAARVTAAAGAPDQWWGYDGADWLVVTTSAGGLADKLSPQQLAALQQWVQLGGKLILSGGGKSQTFANGGVWSQLIPGTAGDVVPLRERLGLESFTGSEFTFDDDTAASRPQVTALSHPSGRVLLAEGSAGRGQPLIVHSPYGLGQVTFVAFDLNHPAIARWEGRRRLLLNLLQGGQTRREEQAKETRRSVTHLGYEDLVGQLRAALEQFDGVAMVNFTTVSVLTIVYLLLIGPGDYLLLSWLRVPRFITWITFPIVAAVFCGLAWYIGGAAHGTRVRINQVEIVDVDGVEGVARGTVWTHVFSPITDRRDLTLAVDSSLVAATKPVDGMLAWQGLPGAGLGGLASQQVSLSTIEPYTVLPPGVQAGLKELPIQVASTKILSARWWGHTALPAASPLTTNEFGLLSGRIANPFPLDLSDCLLIHHESLYRLGTLQAGQEVALADFSPLNLEWRLTKRTVVDTKDQTTPWQQNSTDVPEILQIMMFHEVASGRSYTGLTHRYQSYIDLSDHVRSGRAILVGRAARRATELVQGDKSLGDFYEPDRSWTYFRLVLPVSPPASLSAR